uniref:VWFD domain-containing protein n=1 Tax=Branchiostoma floridae TaxID=7739 RepID=C3ZK51_BRAFL|eukprot:XP_002590939.1 hypothetical protein BRAFLDRAFT_101086 [Branchiostoma floridae]
MFLSLLVLLLPGWARGQAGWCTGTGHFYNPNSPHGTLTPCCFHQVIITLHFYTPTLHTPCCFHQGYWHTPGSHVTAHLDTCVTYVTTCASHGQLQTDAAVSPRCCAYNDRYFPHGDVTYSEPSGCEVRCQEGTQACITDECSMFLSLLVLLLPGWARGQAGWCTGTGHFYNPNSPHGTLTPCCFHQVIITLHFYTPALHTGRPTGFSHRAASTRNATTFYSPQLFTLAFFVRLQKPRKVIQGDWTLCSNPPPAAQKQDGCLHQGHHLATNVTIVTHHDNCTTAGLRCDPSGFMVTFNTVNPACCSKDGAYFPPESHVESEASFCEARGLYCRKTGVLEPFAYQNPRCCRYNGRLYVPGDVITSSTVNCLTTQTLCDNRGQGQGLVVMATHAEENCS